MMSLPNIFDSLILLHLIVQLYGHLAYCSNDRPIFLFLWRWWNPMLCQWTSPSNSLVVQSTCNMHLHHADAASISFNFTPLCFYFCPLFRYFSGYYATLERTRSALTKNCWFLSSVVLQVVNNSCDAHAHFPYITKLLFWMTHWHVYTNYVCMHIYFINYTSVDCHCSICIPVGLFLLYPYYPQIHTVIHPWHSQLVWSYEVLIIHLCLYPYLTLSSLQPWLFPPDILNEPLLHMLWG